MGVLSDLVVAMRSEASIVVEAFPSDSRWPRWDCKGMGTVELDTLESLLLNDGTNHVGVCEQLATGESEECWVFGIPDPMRDRLAELTGERIHEFASAWGKTEEFVRNSIDNDAAAEYLVNLKAAALESKKTQKAVLLWMSL